MINITTKELVGGKRKMTERLERALLRVIEDDNLSGTAQVFRDEVGFGDIQIVKAVLTSLVAKNKLIQNGEVYAPVNPTN